MTAIFLIFFNFFGNLLTKDYYFDNIYVFQLWRAWSGMALRWQLGCDISLVY